MTRSVLLARLLRRRQPMSADKIQHHGNVLKVAFHNQSGSNSSSRQLSSTFWIGAAGTCIFFQIYDNNLHTMTEGRKDDDGGEKKPWYRRYPTLNLETLRSPTVTKSRDDGSDQNPEKKEEKDNKTLFYGQCLKRQLWQPAVPYPAWDYNWDGKMLDDFSTMEVLSTAKGLQQSHKTGTTRHILLVRHGQYEEGPFDDRKRCLTPLGRKQAELTGKRMAELVEDIGADKVNAIHTSDLLRAKQTAWIMAKSMPDSVPIKTPDADLNEGLPAPIVPPRPDLPGLTEEVDENCKRMERVFAKYFYRADPPPELKKALQERAASVDTNEPEVTISTSGTISMGQRPSANQVVQTSTKLPAPKHEFDIIVCHGNMIRFMTCRALQLPPEVWLRLSVFNCSITYLMVKPNGYVTCRMIGDTGHLGYKQTTFSGAHGLLWS